MAGNRAYKQGVALIYMIALFLDRLDLTIVNITLPTVARAFHIALTATDWINLAFLLALAISIPISGWLGERFGFKRIFIIALILFGLGSTLCAAAPNLEILVALRFVHGLGGGMLIPTGMTLVYRAYDKSEYASITSFTFLPALIAPAIAPFLGGVLLDAWSWQLVFLFSGPICLILAVISGFLLREELHRAKFNLDWPGFILFSAMLIDVFYTMSLLGKANLLMPIIFGVLLFILLIYAFIAAEKKAKHALIDLNFFKHELFIKANLIQLCFQICHFGAIFLIGMYLQVGVGMAASMAGLAMGMQAVGAIMISRHSVKLFNRFGARLPITIGLLGVAFLSPCILLIRHSDMLIFAMLLFLLRGLFSGLCGAPIQTLGLVDFEKTQISAVNTVFNAGRQVSISLGVAISSGLMALGMRYANISGAYINPNDVLKVFAPGFLAIFVIAMIGVVITQSLKNNVID